MATPGGLVDKQELIDAQLDTAHLGRVVNSKDASGAPISTSTNRTGGVNKTLDALETEYQADIDNFVQVSDQIIVDKTAEFDTSIANKETEADAAIDAYRLLSKGPYAAGILLEDKFQYITYNGESYFATNPPYTTTATTPDADGNLFPGNYLTSQQLSLYTDIVYKASGGNSAIENMIAGIPISLDIGDVSSTGGTPWIRKALSNPSSINDFKTMNTFNVLDAGLVGDGITNDSQKCQELVDLANAIFQLTGEPQCLYFPPGYTFVIRLITNKPGVNWFSHNAVLLKTPAGSETDENVLKNWRMVTHSQSDFSTDLDLSHRIRFSGFIFDGNLENMNWTNNTYNQEQAHCLFVIGNSAPTSAEKRAKFKVDNCHFRNSVADGLSQYYNSDLIARDITADNCFRGGIVSTGGNSKLNVDGYIGENARFDIEVDGAGFGGTFRLDSVIKNVTIDPDGGGLRPGGIDLGYTDGGTLLGDNIQCFTAPSNFIGQIGGMKGKRFLVTNSHFTTGETTATGNRFIKPVNAKFVNTDFFASPDNPAGTVFDGIQIAFSVGGEDVFNEVIEFNSCGFDVDTGISGIVRRSAIYSPSNISANNNKILVTGESRLSSNFQYGYYLAQGGYIHHKSGRIDSTTAFWVDYSGTSRFFKLQVDQIDRDSEFSSYIKTNSAIAATGNTLIHNETVLDVSKNVFDAAGTKDVTNVFGGRIIYGAFAPTAGQPAWNGDKFRLSTPQSGAPYEWVATNTSWSATATWSTVGNLV